MSNGEYAHGEVHHGEEFPINVDAIFGRLIMRPPVSSLWELDNIRLPDGRYRCEATPRFLNELDVTLVNGRMIFAKDAIIHLKNESLVYRFFSYLSLENARKTLQVFERLDPSSYRESLKRLSASKTHGLPRAKKIYLSELLNYQILVEDVEALMSVSAEEVSLEKNPLAGMATRFTTRVMARDHLAKNYQCMRVLVKRARAGRIKEDEIDEYADLRLEAIALELLMEDPEWLKQ